MTRLDAIDESLLERRIAAWVKAFEDKPGPRVGDFAVLKDGRTLRFSYDWGAKIQVSEGGSFYLDRAGFCNFSGSLDDAIPKAEFVRAAGTREGEVWFFHHDFPQAHSGVTATIPCHVWHQVE